MSIENEIKQMKPDTTGGYAPVNGLKMYYEIHGEGTPLVLIHGGGSTIQTSFGKILPLLAQHYNVIAVELQAHGHTNDRDSAESLSRMRKTWRFCSNTSYTKSALPRLH